MLRLYPSRARLVIKLHGFRQRVPPGAARLQIGSQGLEFCFDTVRSALQAHTSELRDLRNESTVLSFAPRLLTVYTDFELRQIWRKKP